MTFRMTLILRLELTSLDVKHIRPVLIIGSSVLIMEWQSFLTVSAVCYFAICDVRHIT